MPKSTWVVKTDDGYPDSDGKPMADDTRHYDWIVMVVCSLMNLFRGQNVFVAGNVF